MSLSVLLRKSCSARPVTVLMFCTFPWCEVATISEICKPKVWLVILKSCSSCRGKKYCESVLANKLEKL